ncbi:outer membrane protein [Jiella mangrovi]|uniref:Porin family protein n=1 Tax=Jiella mangrovi TaxID=2821407 RepID=A0ABS4BFS0_9HYPH|nr:outer membrane beta-barrel protein [Jiella mangrovi]MBP0615613.1 porin family protein [Jiella mangrovi]
MLKRNSLIAIVVFSPFGVAEAQDAGSFDSPDNFQSVLSFDGAYVGFSGGFSRAERDFSSNFGLLPSAKEASDQASAGFHSGYGTTYGAFYLGTEGDVRFYDDDGVAGTDEFASRWSGSSVGGGALAGQGIGAAAGTEPGSSVSPSVSERQIDISETYRQRIRETVSAKLRAGYVVGRFMPFVTGGVSVGRTDIDYAGRIASERRVDGELVGRSDYLAEVSENEIQFGYTVGGGLEYLVDENISLRGEYAFTDLGTQRYVFQSSDLPDLDVQFDTKVHEARLGFSFRF